MCSQLLQWDKEFFPKTANNTKTQHIIINKKIHVWSLNNYIYVFRIFYIDVVILLYTDAHTPFANLYSLAQ